MQLGDCKQWPAVQPQVCLFKKNFLTASSVAIAVLQAAVMLIVVVVVVRT